MAAVMQSFPPKVGGHWIAACCKTMHANPDVNRKGESKYFVPNDISKFQTPAEIQHVLNGDQIMREVSFLICLAFDL